MKDFASVILFMLLSGSIYAYVCIMPKSTPQKKEKILNKLQDKIDVAKNASY